MKRSPIFLAFIGLFFLKLSLLFWSAHPFDFWSFVNVVHRGTAFGWNVFEYWNKGGLLLWVWYPLYNAYLFILHGLGSLTDNLLLIHFFFKVPFLMIDLACALLIYKTVSRFIIGGTVAIQAALIWYVNPIVFYVYGVHGHYELLTAFGLILMTWGLVSQKPIPIAIGFAIGFTTKYFLIIFLPFIVLYLSNLEKRKRTGFFLVFLFILLIGIFISYAHLTFFPEMLKQTTESIFHLSGMNHGNVVDKLFDYSLESIPKLSGFFLVGHFFVPSALQEDFVRIFAAHWYVFSFVALLLLFVRRFYSVFRSRIYENIDIMKDLFLALMIFLFFLNNFQPHYLAWIVSFSVPVVFLFPTKDRKILMFIFSLLTFFGFIFSLKSEQGAGTFFLDFGKYNVTNAFSDMNPYIMSLYGIGISSCIFLFIFLVVWFSLRKHSVDSPVDRIGAPEYFRILFISAVAWLLMISVFLPNIFSYFRNKEMIDKRISIPYNDYRGSIINGYYPMEQSDISRKTIEIGQKSTNGSLILENLLKGENIRFDEIDSYIAIRKQSVLSAEPFLLRLSEQANFNSCAIEYSKNPPDANRNFDFKEYLFFHVPINCIQENNILNNVWLETESDWSSRDLMLVILSNERGESLSPFSVKFALLGIFYVIFFMAGSFLIFKSIGKADQSNI